MISWLILLFDLIWFRMILFGCVWLLLPNSFYLTALLHVDSLFECSTLNWLFYLVALIFVGSYVWFLPSLLALMFGCFSMLNLLFALSLSSICWFGCSSIYLFFYWVDSLYIGSSIWLLLYVSLVLLYDGSSLYFYFSLIPLFCSRSFFDFSSLLVLANFNLKEIVCDVWRAPREVIVI